MEPIVADQCQRVVSNLINSSSPSPRSMCLDLVNSLDLVGLEAWDSGLIISWFTRQNSPCWDRVHALINILNWIHWMCDTFLSISGYSILMVTHNFIYHAFTFWLRLFWLFAPSIIILLVPGHFICLSFVKILCLYQSWLSILISIYVIL